MTGTILNALAVLGTHVEFIPGGYISKLQGCNVGLNRPFKSVCRKYFESFMVRCGSKERPSRLIVAGWISSAWGEIKKSMIVNTWRHIETVIRFIC